MLWKDRFLTVGCLVYAALFTWLGWVKYEAHRNLVDFGIFAQTVASAFGCFCNPIEGSHWAFHFSPILYPVGVLVGLARSPLVLIALPAAAGALTAPPIYALVLRAGHGRTVARLAALVVWFYPALAGVVFGDFHENSFAPAAVAWTLYAFDTGAMGWTVAGALVTLAIKEDQAIFLAIAGALGAWRFRGSVPGRVAAAICGLSVVVCAGFFVYVHPHAAARFYDWGGSAGGRSALAEIGMRLGFVVLVFLPLLFLPFASRMMWLAAAPLAEVLLSRMPTTFTLGTHYAGAWIGYVLVAFAFAVRRLASARARTLLLWCGALCIVELLVADPLHPGLNVRPRESRDVVLDRFLATLPRGVSVATQEEAYTHLALTDPYARLLPESPSQTPYACFVLLDRAFPDSPRLQEYGPTFAGLVEHGVYVLVDRIGAIDLYRRLAGCR